MCRSNMAQRLQILQPEMNPWKFSVVQAQPEPKPQAQNPTRTMKKVAQPSPTFWIIFLLLADSAQFLEFWGSTT